MPTAESAASSASAEIYTQLSEITGRAASMTGAHGAALAVRQDGRLITVASHGTNAPSMGVEVFPNSFAGQCFEKGSILACQDIDQDPRVDPPTCRALNIGSMVAVPVLVRGKVQGVLAVFAADKQAFSRSKVDLVNTMGIVAGELLLSMPEPTEKTPRTPPVQQEPSAVRDAAPKPGMAGNERAESKIHVVKPVRKASPQTKAVQPRVSAAADSAESKPVAAKAGAEPLASRATATQDSSAAAGSKDAQPAAPAQQPAERRANPPQIVSAPQFAVETPSSGRRGILIVALVLIAAAAGIAFLLHGHSTKPSTAQPSAAVEPSFPSAQEASVPEAAASPATPVAKPAGQSEARTRTAPEARAPQTAQSAPQPAPAPMLIHSPSARNKVEQPEIVAPKLQFATGSAPVLVSAKTYVPRAPVSAVTPATILRKVAPTYPVGVRMTGMVLVTATIQKDGRVGAVRAANGNPVLRAAAMRAIQQWAFRPALLNGQPVESSLEIKVDFSGAR